MTNEEYLKNGNFYEKAGILPEDIEVYVEMEHNYQQYILGEHTAMRNMYAQISPGRVEVEDYYRERNRNLWKCFRFSGITERALMRLIL